MWRRDQRMRRLAPCGRREMGRSRSCSGWQDRPADQERAPSLPEGRRPDPRQADGGRRRVRTEALPRDSRDRRGSRGFSRCQGAGAILGDAEPARPPTRTRQRRERLRRLLRCAEARNARTRPHPCCPCPSRTGAARPATRPSPRPGPWHFSLAEPVPAPPLPPRPDPWPHRHRASPLRLPLRPPAAKGWDRHSLPEDRP